MKIESTETTVTFVPETAWEADQLRRVEQRWRGNPFMQLQDDPGIRSGREHWPVYTGRPRLVFNVEPPRNGE